MNTNAVALYGLKEESSFNAIQPPTRLVAAPVSVWHDWLAPKCVDNPQLMVQELEPAAAVEIQLAAKDQQIADQQSQFARLEELIAAETAARQKDFEQFNMKIEQLKKDHSGEIEQLKKEIEQLKKDHSGEIEQLKKDHKKDQAAQGQRVQLLETEVRKHQEAIAAMGARKATFDKSKVTFDKDFDKIVTAVGEPASTSQARKRSSTCTVAEQEKHTGEEEHDGEDEPQAKKTRREEELDE